MFKTKNSMNLKHKKIVFSERGIGIVGVVIASVIVVISALTVAAIVADQYKQGTKLEVSGNCQNIANSMVEYIKKDETSLFISSYGPTGTQYSGGLDTTVDGIDRFHFTKTPISQFTGPSNTMTIPAGKTTVPVGWKYYNHLNIKNSTNRLVALAASKNYCCDSLDMNDPNCGAKFYDDKMTVPGFKISEKNVQVNLAVDFDGTKCASQRLAAADLPDSTLATKANFKVRVTVQKGTPQEKICEGTGTVQRTLDKNESLTVIQYDDKELCAGTALSPALCNSVVPVIINVRTFKSKQGTKCESSCIEKVAAQTCAQAKSGAVGLFDTFTNGACSACLESEPGAAFLCRIGEKTWFDNPANADKWEPCESTTVKDFNGSKAGDVAITYKPLVSGNKKTQQTTEAIITLSNLRTMRGYVADVRAVDTAGNIGPSFCQAGSPSCLKSSPPHFSLITSKPVLGALADTVNLVGTTKDKAVLGRVNTLTNQVGYQNALANFAGKNYQCTDGGPQLMGSISYSPAPAVNSVPHTCTAVMTRPDGTKLNIPSGAATPGCSCIGLNCTAKLPKLTQVGTYQLQITAANSCGYSGTGPVYTWCLDNIKTIGATQATVTMNLDSTPNFSNAVTPPTTKACHVTTLCPNVGGGFTPTLDKACDTPKGWNAMENSGCIADPKSNFCAVTLDPCGRYQESVKPAPIKYATTLLSTPITSTASANQCFTYNGSQVGGNACETGYCSANGKCYNTCPKKGVACTKASDCDDPIYGVTSSQAGGPTCKNNKCTCPKNLTSPALAACSPVYCPVLNSCPVPPKLGTPPPANVVSCKGCVPWTVGAWGVCAKGMRHRLVSCAPGQCCIGPQPPKDTTCPDCVTPWGTDMPNGTSVTAYQSQTESCGQQCESETRTCNNGVVSGSFTAKKCEQMECADGACGSANGTTLSSAPKTGLCSAGNPTPVSGTGPWTWQCTSPAGLTKNCSAKICSGECSPPVETAGGPNIQETLYCFSDTDITSMPPDAVPNEVSSGVLNGHRWTCDRNAFYCPGARDKAEDINMEWFFMRVSWTYQGVPGWISIAGSMNGTKGLGYCVVPGGGKSCVGENIVYSSVKGQAPPGYQVEFMPFSPQLVNSPTMGGYIHVTAENPCP